MAVYDFINPETFNELEYLASGGLLGRRDPALGKDLMLALADPSIDESVKSGFRRKLCKYDPLMFALLYLRKHISDAYGNVIFAQFHIDTYSWAAETLPYADKLDIADKRTAFIAPRKAGKSTTLFVILPLWALAHRHRKFVTAYGASAEPVQDHLKNVRQELELNELLRLDHSGFVQATTSRDSLYYTAKTNVAMSAKGLDKATRGQKVENLRPDWILFDDVELGESNYSDKEIEKRKVTIRQDIIGGDPSAVVSFVGTVTRAGSIMHDILRTETEHAAIDWVAEDQIKARYYPALITLDNGDKVSMWKNNPEQEWSTEWMLSVEKTNAFQVERMNNPMGKQGKYWSMDDIKIGSLDNPAGSRTILMVDGAVTTKDTSDYTGIAVIRYTPSQVIDGKKTLPTAEVLFAKHYKLVNEDLQKKVVQIISEFAVKGIYIRYVRTEVNNGGDLWGKPHKPNDPRSKSGVFSNLPEGVGLMVANTSDKKEVKFAKAHDLYQKPGVQILHAESFGDLERELIEFPKAKNDDIADAVVMGLLYFLEKKPSKKIRTDSTEYSYL